MAQEEPQRSRRAEGPPPPTPPHKEEGSAPPNVTANSRQAGRGDGAKLVLLGEFGRAHGLSGEVRLKSLTADPLAIARYGPLLAGDGRRLTLQSVRPAAGGAPDLLVARVAGVSSREAAEALNRVSLSVERERLAEPLEEDEYLLADLIGLDAVTAAGEPFGRVLAVPDYGGGELLEIAPAGGGPTLLLPFTKAFVPSIDIAAGRLVVEPPADPAEDEAG